MDHAEVRPGWKSTTWDMATNFAQNFIWVDKRPEESTISYIARESLLTFCKSAITLATFYGVATLATGGLPALAIITAIFCEVVSRNMTSIHPVTDVVQKALRVIALTVGALGLYSLGIQVVTRLAFSVFVGLVANQLSSKRFNENISIQGDTQEEIFRELQKLKREKREIVNLSIQYAGDFQDEKIWNEIMQIKPKNIWLTNNSIGVKYLESVNAKHNSSANETLQFYYYTTPANEEDKMFLSLAVTRADELAVSAPLINALNKVNLSYFTQFKAALNKQEIKRLVFDPSLLTTEIATKLSKFIAFLEYFLDNLSPEEVIFDRYPCGAEVLKCLKTPRNGFCYDLTDRGKAIRRYTGEHQLSTGRVLYPEDIKEGLENLDSRVHTLIIKQPEDAGKPYKVSQEDIDLIYEMRNLRCVRWENCDFFEKVWESINNRSIATTKGNNYYEVTLWRGNT